MDSHVSLDTISVPTPIKFQDAASTNKRLLFVVRCLAPSRNGAEYGLVKLKKISCETAALLMMLCDGLRVKVRRVAVGMRTRGDR